MNTSAILHIPLSQYAFASDEKVLTIRIRTGKDDLTACTLYYGDRACNQTPVIFSKLEMKKIASTEDFDYYEVTFESPYTRVCYYFMLKSAEEWTYYYADQFRKDLPDIEIGNRMIEGRSEYYQYPFILKDEILDVPEWFKHAIVYNIFPDSFASGKRSICKEAKEIRLESGEICRSRNGGTIRGILENLDYIEDMGFNCIYLNPIFVAGEWHKYDILDYYNIDPCFGTNEDFKELVDTIHKKNMHIIIDGVFNHCSWYYFAFDDVVRNGEKSPYVDWFYDLKVPVERPTKESEIPTYSCFAYERKMPKLNTSNLEVQEYFEKVCRFWIREFHIDGWRLDVANEVDKNFWRRFRNAAKEENKDTVLIGEVWENSEVWLRGDMFDSTMNYDFRKHCREFFARKQYSAFEFVSEINRMFLRYPTNIALGQLNLLDTHDVPRFLSLCEDDSSKYKLALAFLFLFPGVPSLFCGDEFGIKGILESEYRAPMTWETSDINLNELIRNLVAIRKKYISPHDKFRMETVEGVLYLIRKCQVGNIVLRANVGNIDLKHILSQQNVLLTSDIKGAIIKPHGFVIYIEEK